MAKKKPEPKTDGADLILLERIEQLGKHDHSVLSDVKHNNHGQLAYAAQKLLSGTAGFSNGYPAAPLKWNQSQWEYMCDKPYMKRLIIAGALIAAEYDRLTESQKDIKQA